MHLCCRPPSLSLSPSLSPPLSPALGKGRDVSLSNSPLHMAVHIPTSECLHAHLHACMQACTYNKHVHVQHAYAHEFIGIEIQNKSVTPSEQGCPTKLHAAEPLEWKNLEVCCDLVIDLPDTYHHHCIMPSCSCILLAPSMYLSASQQLARQGAITL